MSYFWGKCRKLVTLSLITAGCTNNSVPEAQSELGAEAGLDSVRVALTSKVSTYRAAMPNFAYDAINEIVRSSDTIWYDKESMVPTYQDSVGHGRNAPIGMRKNSEGARLINIIPGGRALFSPDEKTWEFPFAHTAGTDRSTNVTIANFVSLPKSNGKILPVAYWVVNDPRTNGGLGLLQWRWIFPKGTIVGELIYIKGPDNELYLSELRTRERQTQGWATNVFKPFPTAASLSSAIKQRRQNWQQNPALVKLISHLDNEAALKPLSLSSKAFPGTFNQSGFIDELPDIDDPALVKSLLRETTFVSAYGIAWKKSASAESYSPSTKQNFSVVPNNYQAGLIEVRDSSCKRCHEHAQRKVVDFVPQAILYGDIWGSDEIFSFHPFDQSRYSADGRENRAVRPEFIQSGVVVKYDSNVHTSDFYRTLK